VRTRGALIAAGGQGLAAAERPWGPGEHGPGEGRGKPGQGENRRDR
jgi:hypothetical protein